METSKNGVVGVRGRGVSDAAYQGHLKKMSVDPKASRLGKPSEVGSLVAFLLSEDSTFINGESITCAGGVGSSRYC
ncbi:hypothetical protein BSL78_08398 [Apostichopus japonicus]|uniref:Uncharacterized protein n=1 Tax=Stichopus japonicus TaxID=307972 RepID=A0A2G8L377_STIJA|nr:hypothetical protein BSL78_08398 [Apostichopus japonicus]